MREIVFKAKRIDNDEWIYGVSPPFWEESRKMIYAISWRPGFDDRKDFYYSGCAEVYLQTVGQYIGLNDKNNNPIFEWDIVKFREWDKGDMCWIGVVHYKHQQFIVSGNPNKECDTPFEIAMSGFISDNIEVIGNFYDDPDILFQED